MKRRYTLILLLVTLLTVSCSDNGNDPDPLEFSSVYVTNEGAFGNGNGSVTSYDLQAKNALQKAFENASGRPLAGLVQSSRIVGDRMVITLNTADKIEVVDSKTLESIGTVSLSIPPTAVDLIDDNTAYVTTLDYQTSVDSVLLVSLSEMKQTNRRIAVGNTPRDIVHVGKWVYVSNSGSNTISVINSETESVERNIDVGTSPGQMVIDDKNRIWISCNGLKSYDESTESVPGSIYVLDGQDGSIIDSIQSSDISPRDSYVFRLALDNEDNLAYFINNGIAVIDMNSITMTKRHLTTRSFYSIGYFPEQKMIYAGQLNGYTQAGQAILFTPEGAAVDSFQTGIAPNRFYFTTEN